MRTWHLIWGLKNESLLSGGQEQDELENEIGQCGFSKESEPESKMNIPGVHCLTPEVWLSSSLLIAPFQRKLKPVLRRILAPYSSLILTLDCLKFKHMPLLALIFSTRRFFSIMKVKVKVKSGPTLCDPWTVAHQAPPSMEFSRQECWSGGPLPSPQ